MKILETLVALPALAPDRPARVSRAACAGAQARRARRGVRGGGARLADRTLFARRTNARGRSGRPTAAHGTPCSCSTAANGSAANRPNRSSPSTNQGTNTRWPRNPSATISRSSPRRRRACSRESARFRASGWEWSCWPRCCSGSRRCCGACVAGAWPVATRDERRRGGSGRARVDAGQRRRMSIAMRGRAGGFGCLTGIVLFSHMARLHPRYVEGLVPAVGATLGIGAAWACEASRAGAAGRACGSAGGRRLLRRAAAVRHDLRVVDLTVRRTRRAYAGGVGPVAAVPARLRATMAPAGSRAVASRGPRRSRGGTDITAIGKHISEPAPSARFPLTSSRR